MKSDGDDDLPELSFDGPSKATTLSIREAVAGDLHHVAPRSLGTRALHALVAAIIVGTLTVASFGPRALTHAFGEMSPLGLAATITVTVVLLGSLAFAPRWQTMSRDSRVLLVVGLIAAWSIYLVASVSSPDWSSASSSGNCMWRSLGSGFVATAAFMWVWRKTDPWTPRISGALIGVTAGIVASTHVTVVCAGGAAGHVLVGHWLVVPLLALGGFAVARRVLAP